MSPFPPPRPGLPVTGGSPLGVLLMSVRAKHPGGARHIDRVRALARSLGEAAGSVAHRHPEAETALLLHEIGTIGISDALLHKQGPLTTAEMESVQAHTSVGAEILRPIDGMGLAAQVAEAHHEWWDGSGYPRRLARQEIPALARIVAVANAYVALTSDRPHRSAVGHDIAVAEITGRAGSQFEPAIAAALAGLPPRAARGITIIPARS